MFTPFEIAERIKLCAKEHGITVKSALKEAGVGEKMVSNMGGKKGSYPQSDKLAQIADYFNCSVDYLLGRGQSKKNDEPSLYGSMTINEITILELFKALTETQQGEIIGRAKMMIEQNESVYKQEDAV